jgi:hypothetical protein
MKLPSQLWFCSKQKEHGSGATPSEPVFWFPDVTSYSLSPRYRQRISGAGGRVATVSTRQSPALARNPRLCSFFLETVGGAPGPNAAVTRRPLPSRSGITFDHDEPSAHAPRTRITFEALLIEILPFLSATIERTRRRGVPSERPRGSNPAPIDQGDSIR